MERQQSYLFTLSRCNHNLSLLRLAGLSKAEIPCLSELLENPRTECGTAAAGGGTYLETQYSNFLPPELTIEIRKCDERIPLEDLQKIADHDKIRRRLFAIHMEQSKQPGRSVLDLKRANRIWGCQNGHMVLSHLEQDKTMMVPYACRSVSCPVCSRRASADKFLHAWKALSKRCNGNWRRLRLREMILTVRNVAQGDLDRGLLSLLASWRRFRQRCDEFRDNVDGCLWSVEITYNAKSKTYHPHIHILYSGNYIKRGAIAPRWSFFCRQRDLYACPRNSIFIKEVFNGQKSDDNQALSALKEVTKYTVKPLEGSTTPAAVVIEITDAIRGTNPDKPRRLNLKGSWGNLEFKHEKNWPAWVNLGGLAKLLDDKTSDFWRYPALQKQVLEAMSKKPEHLAAIAANYPALYYAMIGGNEA